MSKNNKLNKRLNLSPESTAADAKRTARKKKAVVQRQAHTTVRAEARSANRNGLISDVTYRRFLQVLNMLDAGAVQRHIQVVEEQNLVDQRRGKFVFDLNKVKSIKNKLEGLPSPAEGLTNPQPLSNNQSVFTLPALDLAGFIAGGEGYKEPDWNGRWSDGTWYETGKGRTIEYLAEEIKAGRGFSHVTLYVIGEKE